MKGGAMLLVAGLLLLLAAGASAAGGGSHDLSWFTVDGGGVTSVRGGGYTLDGTAGQADAGVLTGAVYTLIGGLSAGGMAAPPAGRELYLPLVVRGG